MDLKKEIIEILLKLKGTEGEDGSGKLEWLYEEMVQAGYQGTEEEFYEEFTREFEPILERETMKEIDVNQIAGGAGNGNKKLQSAALAGLIAMGGCTGGAGATAETKEPVICRGTAQSAAIKLTQTVKKKASDLYGKLTKLLNQGDINTVVKPATGVIALGLGVTAIVVIFYKFILPAIKNSETPEKTVEKTIQGLQAILNNSKNDKESRQAILIAIVKCLEKLISFLPVEEQEAPTNALKKLQNKWGVGENNELSDDEMETPKTVEKLKREIGDVTAAMGDSSQNVDKACVTLSDFLQQQNNAIESVLKLKEEKTKRTKTPLLQFKSIYLETFTANHQSRTKEELKDPAVLEQETGVRKEVWKTVDEYTRKMGPGVHYTDLTDDTVLLVINCPGKYISSSMQETWWPDYKDFGERIQGKKLFVHVEEGLLGDRGLSGLQISVLDVAPKVTELLFSKLEQPIVNCTIRTALFRGYTLKMYDTNLHTVLTVGRRPGRDEPDYATCRFPANVEIRNLFTGELEDMSKNYSLFKCKCESTEEFRERYKYPKTDNEDYNVKKLEENLNFNSENKIWMGF